MSIHAIPTAKKDVQLSLVEWRDAVNKVITDVEEWAPHDFERVRTQDGLELDFQQRRIYLQPASWAVGEFPARLDLWSSVGPRVRIVVDEAGNVEILTSDLIPLRRTWSREIVAELCRDLIRYQDLVA